MTVLIPLSCGVAALASGALIADELRRMAVRDSAWMRAELRFARQTPDTGAAGFLARIAGLHYGSHVVLEIAASASGIRHFVETDRSTLATLRTAVAALAPGAELVDVELPAHRAWMAGRMVRLRGRLGVLQSDDHEPAAHALLAAIQPLAGSDRVVVRWTLRAGHAVQLPHADRDGTAVPGDDRARLRDKNRGAVVVGRCVVAASTSSSQHAQALLGRVSAVLRTRNTAYGWLRSYPRSGHATDRLVNRRRFWFADRYAAHEIAGLLGWPSGDPQLPGVSQGTSPRRMPSREIPTRGRVLGDATWPGSGRPIAQPLVGALSHSLLAGPTGVGKSTLVANLIEQDLLAGRGLVLIDGKGDTVQTVLERVPRERAEDVIVLDCADTRPLPGLRLLSDRSDDPELTADVVLSIFADLFKDSFGVLAERYLRAGLAAIARDPEGSLADVPYVFSDAAYRRKILGRTPDGMASATLAAYDAMSDDQKTQQLASTLNKLSALLGRPTVRAVLGQTDPKLDFRRVLAGNQIVLISLAPGRTGTAAARLLGAVLVFALLQAVQARAEIPAEARKPFMIYIDEPRVLGRLPVPVDVILEQARGLGVGLSISPQSVSQLPRDLRTAILTNAATRVAFSQNADDAALLARDLTRVAAEDLQDLAAYEAVARIGLGPGRTSAPVTVKTRPLSPKTSDGRGIRDQSAARYGRTLADIDAAIAARHGAPCVSPDEPIGRVRRQP